MPSCPCGICDAIRAADRERRPWWRRAFSFLPPMEVFDRAIEIMEGRAVVYEAERHLGRRT